LQGLISSHIPTKNVKSVNKSPWVNRELKILQRKQRNLHSRAKRSGIDQDWIEFRAVRSKASSLSSKLYNQYIQKSLDDGQYSKTFWRFIKSKRKDSGIPAIRLPNGDLSNDPKTKANVLNSVLKENYNYNIPTHDIAVDFVNIPEEMNPILVSANGICNLLSQINPSKSAGPDGIPGRVLKSLAPDLAPYLEILFNQIIATGLVPEEWKTAFVVPIPKGGDKHNSQNYRPISLTCIVSRIFEHVLHSSITSHLRANSVILPNQHGFSKGLSCETQLISIFHDLCMTMDKRIETDMIFLDFKKAFDRVPHCHLLSKLRALRIDLNVLAVIESFLSGRSQRVIVEGALSESVPVVSGVPQGSVLGPLLFIIYINDLSNGMSSHVRLFADDCVLYREINSENDHATLQNDLSIVEDWCHTWGMELNLSKCVSMTISRLHNRGSRLYKLGSLDLEQVTSYKYLGVTLSSNLSWDDHVSSSVNKANRALGFVRRNLKNCTQPTKSKCVTTLVRPHLEYASSACDPFLAAHIHKLEMVQRRAVRFITNKYGRTESVTKMLKETGLPLLQTRRKIARQKLFFKIDSKLIPLKVPQGLRRKESNGRRDNGKAYVHFSTRSNPLFSSYYPKTVRDWNDLPSVVVFSPSLSSFSNTLKKTAGVIKDTPGCASL